MIPQLLPVTEITGDNDDGVDADDDGAVDDPPKCKSSGSSLSTVLNLDERFISKTRIENTQILLQSLIVGMFSSGLNGRQHLKTFFCSLQFSEIWFLQQNVDK